MAKKNYRRVSVVVTAQTLGNLEKLAKMSGYGNLGLVVDKLVREKMIQLRAWSGPELPEERKPRFAGGASPSPARSVGSRGGTSSVTADAVPPSPQGEGFGGRRRG